MPQTEAVGLHAPQIIILSQSLQSVRSFKQYLAVGPLSSSTHVPEVGVSVRHPTKASIQIWSLSPSRDLAEDKHPESPDPGQLKCEMVLCIDAGSALELKWCPLPSHDSVSNGNYETALFILASIRSARKSLEYENLVS